MIKIITFILMIPALLVAGIALGPAALVMLFVVAIAVPVLLVVGWFERKPRLGQPR
jgi:hypothetical protein